MDIYIDCEWNSFGGDLISMALVADDGREFYQVLPCDNPDPWVIEHVIPVLNQRATTLEAMRTYLQWFLMGFDSIHIIADWPEDIERFCAMLITGPGMRLNTPPLTMEVLRVDSVSLLPHNALEDARALRFHCLANRSLSKEG